MVKTANNAEEYTTKQTKVAYIWHKLTNNGYTGTYERYEYKSGYWRQKYIEHLYVAT